MVKRHVFQFVPTNMSTYVQHKGLYATYSSWHIDPWNNRKVWVDKYFSDDQLIFFLFGQGPASKGERQLCIFKEPCGFPELFSDRLSQLLKREV